MTQDNVPPPPPPPDPAFSPVSGDPPPPPISPGPLPPPATLSYRAEDGTYVGPAPDGDSRTMGMLCHLLGIFTGFIGPLIIWLMKKDQSPFVDDQGKESLNWHFTILIGFLIGGVTWCLVIGIVIILALWVCNLVFSIMGSLKANQGIAYRYPWSIKFIK